MPVSALRVASRWVMLFLATIAVTGAAAALLPFTASAQESPKPSVISAHARMMAARSIYIEHAGGRLANDVIGDAFRGWGHYVVVGDPGRADLIVSINAPVSDSGVTVGGSGGRQGSSPANNGKSLSGSSYTQIRLFILDAHDRVVLWSSGEQPRSSFKEKQREENEVNASLTLFRRFRELIEPEPAP